MLTLEILSANICTCWMDEWRVFTKGGKMNLLTDDFLSIRKVSDNSHCWISLKQLLCSSDHYSLMYPRDDIELGALCLCIAIVQCLWTPDDLIELKQRIVQPLSENVFYEGIKPYLDWFNISHNKYPFMQVKGVKAKEVTPLDKLLPGITGGTNCVFVNEPSLAECLCGGCSGIALFNDSANAPGFGGGFKAGLRGSSPITTLVQGTSLRETIWVNVLTKENIQKSIPAGNNVNSNPTWVDPIIEKSKFSALSIGLIRGLLWQPAHIELTDPIEDGKCTCCGKQGVPIYSGFLKAKFNYTVEDRWPHPHSPRYQKIKGGSIEENFASFTTTAPSWTHLARFVIKQSVAKNRKEGQIPALVINQARDLFGRNAEKLQLLVGGYQNNQATILDRRHEVLQLGMNWNRFDSPIQEIVSTGLGYKSALRGALYIFAKGADKIKGLGLQLYETGEQLFYQRTQIVIESVLSNSDFANMGIILDDLKKTIKTIGWNILEEQTEPYLHDPELIHTLAVAKRTWWKKIKDLQPMKEEISHG